MQNKQTKQNKQQQPSKSYRHIVFKSPSISYCRNYVVSSVFCPGHLHYLPVLYVQFSMIEKVGLQVKVIFLSVVNFWTYPTDYPTLISNGL